MEGVSQNGLEAQILLVLDKVASSSVSWHAHGMHGMQGKPNRWPGNCPLWLQGARLLAAQGIRISPFPAWGHLIWLKLMFSHVKCSFHSSPLPIFLHLIFIPFVFGKDQGKTPLIALKG